MTVNRTPTLGEVILDGIESRFHDLHVALPAKVVNVGGVSFDAKTQCCHVQPLIKDRVVQDDGSIVAESMPIVMNVPVVFPGGGGFRLQFDLVEGDDVLMIVAGKSIDKWLSYGGDVDPGDPRIHNLSDAIAIPGLRSFNQAWTGDGKPSIGYEAGPRVAFTKTQIELGGTGDRVALATQVMNDLTSLTTAVNDFVGKYNIHTHAASGADAPKPTAASADDPGEVASAKVVIAPDVAS